MAKRKAKNRHDKTPAQMERDVQKVKARAKRLGIFSILPALSSSGKVTKRTHKLLSCASRLVAGNPHDPEAGVKEKKRFDQRKDRLIKDAGFVLLSGGLSLPNLLNTAGIRFKEDVQIAA